MQFQNNYETLQTSALIASATTALIAAGTRLGAHFRQEVPLTIVIDSVAASGLGTAGFVTISSSGTVLTRIGFAANDMSVFGPIHLRANVGDAIGMFASGSAGAVNVNYHRE